MPLTKIIYDSYYIASNAPLVVANTNLLMKGGAFGYGITITGASAFDAFTALAATSKCLFGIGCLCGAAGTRTTGFSMFNTTVGLPVFGVLGEATIKAFFWLGRRANQVGNLTNF